MGTACILLPGYTCRKRQEAEQRFSFAPISTASVSRSSYSLLIFEKCFIGTLLTRHARSLPAAIDHIDVPACMPQSRPAITGPAIETPALTPEIADVSPRGSVRLPSGAR